MLKVYLGFESDGFFDAIFVIIVRLNNQIVDSE